MRIGLTCDLRQEYLAMGFSREETAEFDSEETAEGIEAALRALGHEVVRIGNIRALVTALAQGERWDAVFNICEGLRGFGREAQVPALLEAYDIPYTFADPLCAAVTLHKGVAKRVLRDAGIPTAPFAVVERLEDVEQVDLPYPLFVKPVAEGTGKGVKAQSRVTDPEGLRRECARVLREHGQPALVETYLPGREFSTAMVGEGETARAIGTEEIVLDPAKKEAYAYTFENKQSNDGFVFTMADPESAAACGALAERAWRALGCRDAGRIDLRTDAEGRLQVLEANPLPGMRPGFSDLPLIADASGMPFVELVRVILDGALSRRR